jgi:hypothetical protein
MKLSALNIIRLVSASFATAALAANEPAAAPPAPNTVEAGTAPKIQFDAQAYEFGKVASGEVIQHTFIVSNAGNAMLAISGVRPSCGCTTAGAWSKEIAPGKTGVIPIQINSSALHGTVEKQVTVTSNDKLQPSVVLRLRGSVWKPIEFSPQFAALHLTADPTSNVTAVVLITNKTDQPVTLSTPVSANQYFTGTLKTIEPGKQFELTVTAVPPFPTGNVMGSISIKTSITNMAALNIPVTAIAPQPALFVIPTTVRLSPAVPNQTITQTVTIQATAAQPLTLSEPGVNAKGIDVLIKELQPGRRYTLTLKFPEGFQITPGEALELSVKSNYPQFPVIKVPITQLPAPARVAAKKD